MRKIIYNHVTSKLSKLDYDMIQNIPPGGNWRDIPLDIPSERLAQIRRTGGRTTYYGRLKWASPSYTISTFFNRPGNGCYIHPDDGSQGKPAQNRLITYREAARLQSFPDDYRFFGTKRAILKQIGNAVPPLLARAIASGITETTFVDLFSGAGGMSLGFLMTGKKLVGAIENDKFACETMRRNHPLLSHMLLEGDITELAIKEKLYATIRSTIGNDKLGIVIGGPPCQGFSLAGNRFVDDPRNQLFKHFVDIVKELEPNVFLMENVPGFLSSNNGTSIIEVVQCFRDLSYVMKKPIILKAEAYGVPQKRRRLFIIGHKLGVDVDFPPEPMFGEHVRLIHRAKPVVTVREAIFDLPPIGEGLGLDEITIDNWLPKYNYQKLMSGLLSFEEFYELR